MTCATPTLFDGVRTRRARKPEAVRLAKRGQTTSLEAALEHVASGQHTTDCLAVFAALQRWPGRTSRKLAELAGLDRPLVGRRLPDLKKRGWARKGEIVKDDNGIRAATWWPAEVR